MKAYGLLLACTLLVLATGNVTAQDATQPDRIDLLFEIGTTAMTGAELTDSDVERRAFYDKAIAAFRRILIDRPELVRVRLELARAFFLNGQDGLARRHFEALLAGGVPPPVANIRQFLAIMQARKR